MEKLEEIILDYRGLEGAKKKEFLSPQHPAELSPEEFGLTDEVLGNAASVIFSAIEKECPIIIHGDFDADGVCATSILWKAIYEGLGYEKCLPFIPDRFEHGYGISEQSLREITNNNPPAGGQISNEDELGLLITVDCGITAKKEIKVAREMGWEVLVTDHHQKVEGDEGLEGAAGVVWTDKICGAGIAYVFAKKLANSKFQITNFKEDPAAEPLRPIL